MHKRADLENEIRLKKASPMVMFGFHMSGKSQQGMGVFAGFVPDIPEQKDEEVDVPDRLK